MDTRHIQLPWIQAHKLNTGLLDAFMFKTTANIEGADYNIFDDPDCKDHPATTQLLDLLHDAVPGWTPDRAWVKNYGKGEYVTPHTHGNCHIAVTYNVQGMGFLCIEDEKPICTKPGMFVVFDPRKTHWSDPNKFDLRRIVVASNMRKIK